MMSQDRADSPYSRLNYRRLIAWPGRIERESPFLLEEIGRAPEASVVDLGCGTGEHARYLASQGIAALGVDRSEAQIDKAMDFFGEFPAGPEFVLGEIEDLGRLTDRRFGAAICLGNVLPHLDDAALGRALEAIAGRLLPGGRLIVQLLNYERIFRRGDRHLPLNIRDDPEEDGEIVFLRLMVPDGDDHVRFFPTTLLLESGKEPPLTIKSSKEVRLRAWKVDELGGLMETCGLQVERIYGTMKRDPFDPAESSDLIVTATRAREPS